MSAFNLEQFAKKLLAESLFYDEEYGALVNISLINEEEQKEQYIASFDPEGETYVIEEAVEWEDIDADRDGEIDYALAVDGKEHACFETPDEAADELLALARQHGLTPSLMLLFEDEG
jgi:hypothetical protein